MKWDLKERVVVVTGASGDLGQAISKRFHKCGARVVGLGHGWLPNLNLEMEMRIDVTDSVAVDNAFQKIEQRLSRIDVLVNNVGVSFNRLAIRLNDKEWKRILDVNLMGAVRCCRAAAKPMILQKSGSIINISSLAAHHPNPGQVAYAASKAAMEAMTRTMALEWGGKRIRVNAIAPGFIEGKMIEDMGSEQRERVLEHSPLGRLGKPDEVAYVAAFLASDDASYITGQVLDVSGGLGM